MRICLVAPGQGRPGDASVRRLAALLGGAHEVVVVEPPAEPSEEALALTFCGEGHRRAAGVMEAIRAHYGERGPDYLEVRDGEPLGFVALQARQTGDPLLTATAVGVRAAPSAELRALHDGLIGLPEQRRAAELERWQLSGADRLLAAGGDTLALYSRYYGAAAPAIGLRAGVPPAASPPPSPPPSPRPSPGGPLRILCLAELRRSRGVLDLLSACLSLDHDGWELTLAGADTRTATMGQSVRESLAAMADEDPRVRVLEQPGDGGAALLAAADLVVLADRVQAASEVGELALGAGLPLLATPVGGHTELVVDGVTGWLAEDFGPRALARALAPLLAAPERLERLRADGAIAAHAARLADPARTLAAYDGLAVELGAARGAQPLPPAPAPRPGAVLTPVAEPAVSAIVPYHGASRFVAEAVGSALAQTHRLLEVLVVNDGSFAPADAVLGELAEDPRVTVVTQANAGESSARNLAAVLARGEYLVMLDADNLLEPRFVERALRAYAARPDLSYVTCWLRMIDENGEEMPPEHGYAALGNGVVEDDDRNWDGDTLAMLPRRLFTELGYHYGPEGSMHSDWELYRWLRQEGRFGAVVPERLARYRVLPGSVLRGHGQELQDHGWAESVSRNRTRRTRWIAPAPS